MPPYRRVIVHAGVHRTGTTALQYQLRDRVPRGVVDVAVPRVDHFGRRGFSGRLPGLDEPVGGAPVAATLLISNEGLLGHFTDGYQFAPERLLHLREALPEDVPSTVMLTVRPLLPWLESAYRAWIREGASDLPSEFIARVMSSRWVRWPETAALFYETFQGYGPAVVAASPATDTTAAVAAATGLTLDTAQTRAMGRLNASLSAEHTAWLRAFNATGEVDAHRREVIVDLLARLPSSQGPMSCFPIALQEQLVDLTLADWSRLQSVIASNAGASTPPPGRDAPVAEVLPHGGVIDGEGSAQLSLLTYAADSLAADAARRSTVLDKTRDLVRATLRR